MILEIKEFNKEKKIYESKSIQTLKGPDSFMMNGMFPSEPSIDSILVDAQQITIYTKKKDPQ